MNRKSFCGGRMRFFSVTALSVCFLASAFAEEAKTKVGDREVDWIMDNSFLVEEAYNQEAGVVQHIGTAKFDRDRESGVTEETWSLTFTEEWPVCSQKHQFSYTIPYDFVKAGGQSVNGFGDVLLNYRFQAYFDEETLMAFAPRASIVLPTGNEKKGLGDDTVGCQFNLPFSTSVGDRWFIHLNAGLTHLPDAASAQNRDLTSYNFGVSAIFAATRDFNWMLEWVGDWDQFGEPGVPRDREFTSVLSAGMRKAFNFSNESQLVLGVAVPIGLTKASPDVGVFLYVSFEHFFIRQK